MGISIISTFIIILSINIIVDINIASNIINSIQISSAFSFVSITFETWNWKLNFALAICFDLVLKYLPILNVDINLLPSNITYVNNVNIDKYVNIDFKYCNVEVIT